MKSNLEKKRCVYTTSEYIKHLGWIVLCIVRLCSFSQVTDASPQKTGLAPRQVLSKIFNIYYEGNTATGTLIQHHDKTFLITVRHLFVNMKNKTPLLLDVFRDSSFSKLRVIAYFHQNPSIDVAILELKDATPSQMSFKADADASKFYLTQECYFFGFPFNLRMIDRARSMNDGFPIPFVKKAIISALVPEIPFIIYLDGHNNPGFSGGPVFVNNVEDGENVWRLIGVVSGYINDNKKIQLKNETFTYSENSGIVQVIGLKHAFEILNQIN